jgi:hypothetical protein
MINSLGEGITFPAAELHESIYIKSVTGKLASVNWSSRLGYIRYLLLVTPLVIGIDDSTHAKQVQK